MSSQFQAASSWLSSTPAAASLPNETKLELYGLFKVANTPTGPSGPRPSIFYPAARAKYDAWVVQAGKFTAQEARERYVNIAKEIGWDGQVEEDDDIEWDEPTAPTKSSGMGTRVSMMAQEQQSRDDGGSPIHEAVAAGSSADVAVLLAKDPALVNVKDEYGNTPLHLAADRGHASIARLLLEKGADVNATDDDHQTPLQLARISGRDELASLLSDT